MKRKAISSIYGFVMIFLLTMASIQTWSSAVGSIASVEGASDQSHALQQMQGIEHLSLASNDGNLTISNDGEVPSTIEFLRLAGQNSSKTIQVDAELAVGGTLVEPIPSGYSVEVVTGLGNVFVLRPGAGALDPIWTGTYASGGATNAQLYQSPYDSSFFLASGSSVFAFWSNGTEQWSFDGGYGVVTGVMPLASGDVFVSSGSGLVSNTADLYELSPTGSLIGTYPVRLFQTPSSAGSPSLPPVTTGEDSSSAYYDGWFYSSAGQGAGLESDLFPILGTDSSDFYFYRVTAVPSDDGTCDYARNEVVVYSYTPSSFYASGFNENWDQYVYFQTCNRFPQQLVGSSVADGVIAALFASPSYAAAPVEVYPAESPYLVVLSDSGAVLYEGPTPSQSYSSIANNGTTVYMAVPQASEIQELSAATGVYSTYPVGIQATNLLFEYGHLFAISDGAVGVFDSSMHLQKTITFAPLGLASYSDSSTLLTSDSPSFLVLNSTACAALLTNSTGYVSLAIESYA